MRAAIITVSTSRATDDDAGGDELERFARGLGAEVVGRDLIQDQREQIAERLRFWSDRQCDLVLTTGGTGFSPNDVTPEATRQVIEKEAPGLAEAMRQVSRAHTPHWMLSRGVSGIRRDTLIINFPGNPQSIAEAGAAIEAALPHAVDLLNGRSSH